MSPILKPFPETALQGDLLETAASPLIPQPAGLRHRIRRRAADSLNRANPPVAGQARAHRQIVLASLKRKAVPGASRYGPCRHRAVGRPRRTRRDRQWRDGLRQDDRRHRHGRRAQRRRLPPHPGALATPPGPTSGGAKSRRRWPAPRSGCSTARTRCSSSSNCASSWACRQAVRSSSSWAACGCGWASTGSPSSPASHPPTATWRRARTAAMSSPTSTASRSTRSSWKPRSSAASAASAPHRCGR